MSAAHRRWIVFVSPLLRVVALASCHGAAAEQDSSPNAPARLEAGHLVLAANSPHLPSLAATPVVRDRAASVSLNGRLAWNENVTVRVFSPFAGRIARVFADAGRRVRTRDTLALIAAPDFGQAQADARRASTDLARAERVHARQRDLFQHGVVAQKEVEEAEADASRARAEYQRAAARVVLYGGDTASVDQRFPLESPLAGEVVERNTTPGSEVRPDQMLANAPPLFVVTDPSVLWVMLDVPEQEMSTVKEGAPIVVHAQAWPDRVFHARIAHVAGALDPLTRTLKVRATVDNPDRLLKAEMLVTVDLTRPSVAELAVPAAAVLLAGDAHVVFVEERPGRYERRQVRIGAAHDGLVPVMDGLRAGERVVTGSTLLLEQLFRVTARS